MTAPDHKPPSTLAEGIEAEKRGEGRVVFVNGVPTWQAKGQPIWWAPKAKKP